MAVADVVLPAATFPERDGIRVGDGCQRGEVINRVTRIGECKSDMEINLELGKRLNPGAWPWDNVEDMFTRMLKPIGMTFAELREKAPAYLPSLATAVKRASARGMGSPASTLSPEESDSMSTFHESADLIPCLSFLGAVPRTWRRALARRYPVGAHHRRPRLGGVCYHSEHRQVGRLCAL